ncbi:hypothetical protein DPMN_166636 [Dreissena polymorpha]|uniref:Uncharacterized protein n=1 Tax=Dreissena polymorpha TaxID=45954 RepID=A0A9D4F2X0_DREPO|nr:hypothetical protein DPMN_166636 [Dreissena polymorpha]
MGDLKNAPTEAIEPVTSRSLGGDNIDNAMATLLLTFKTKLQKGYTSMVGAT